MPNELNGLETFRMVTAWRKFGVEGEKKEMGLGPNFGALHDFRLCVIALEFANQRFLHFVWFQWGFLFHTIEDAHFK